MKRLVIYFHYDAQGLLDEPCRFALQAMLPVGDLVLVTNGTLRQEDRIWALDRGIDTMERENIGFDVGAYRHALLTLGREKICAYEELVLMNYTLAGPICPLQNMFDAMQRRTDLDFWGLTRHYAMQSRRFGGNVPAHLQSHFLAIRKSLLQQDAFWTYWQSMRLPRSYEESVIRHETRFTSYFEELGFSWDSYVQTEDLKPVFVNPIMACPRELLEHRSCPFFKRRSFFTPYEDELRRTDGNAAQDLYDYLTVKTEYPVSDLIISLMRNHPLSALVKNLHWHYIVREEDASKDVVDLEKEGLQLLCFPRPDADPVTSWYLSERFAWANQAIPQAVKLFQEHPLLGILCPAVPAWPEAVQLADRKWLETRRWLQERMEVPMDDFPPPAPLAGWLLVRKKVFPQGVPGVDGARQAWLTILQAQKNGYYTADFESDRHASGKGELLQVYIRTSRNPVGVAKQLGRLVKHSLQGVKKGERNH